VLLAYFSQLLLVQDCTALLVKTRRQCSALSSVCNLTSLPLNITIGDGDILFAGGKEAKNVADNKKSDVEEVCDKLEKL